jgi:hypothetical protein
MEQKVLYPPQVSLKAGMEKDRRERKNLMW